MHKDLKQNKRKVLRPGTKTNRMKLGCILCEGNEQIKFLYVKD